MGGNKRPNPRPAFRHDPKGNNIVRNATRFGAAITALEPAGLV